MAATLVPTSAIKRQRDGMAVDSETDDKVMSCGWGGAYGGAGGATKKRCDEGAVRLGCNAENRPSNLMSPIASSSASSLMSPSSSSSSSYVRPEQGNEKRSRRGEAANDGAAYNEDRLRYLEDSLSHTRDEYTRAMQRKDAELEELRRENAVLKKGVAIAANRQAEAYTHNGQLQEVLARAAEHIASQERCIALLQTRLQYHEGGGGNGLFQPPPPPDCF